MKKETIEEAAENHLQKWRLLNNTHLSNILHAERCKNDFIAGATWQAERMYSEEEVKTLIGIINWYDDNSDVRPNFEIPEIKKGIALIDWFIYFEEQFKKK